jgi:hypothetical protein
MKKTFTFLLAILMATTVSAQNILLGGNMESATDWTVTNLHGGAPNPVLTWNETTYTPSMGEGGCLRVTSPGGASPSSTVAIYQAVTLEAGKLYTFNGAFIDNAGGLLEAGIQVYLGATEPGTADYSDGWLCEYNSWVPGYEPADRDDTFETGATGSRKLLCATSGTYYLVVKVGLWNTHNMDISLDELTLTASEVVPITGGGLLQNGTMETMGAWTESTLNSNPAPVSTWGYTTDSPQFGNSGCLRLVGTKPATSFTNFCVYQKVSLQADKTYEYDLAFKDISAECKEAWIEVYLGSSEPVSGTDYTEGKIGLLSSWNPTVTPLDKDITFQSAAGDVKNFICPATQDYYFVIKAGSNFDFDFLFDEVYFREKGSITAVKEIKAANHKIRTVNSTIVVDGVTSKVELFDLSGRCLQSQKMSGTFSSKILNTGLYIVRVDGFTSKIVVR